MESMLSNHAAEHRTCVYSNSHLDMSHLIDHDLQACSAWRSVRSDDPNQPVDLLQSSRSTDHVTLLVLVSRHAGDESTGERRDNETPVLSRNGTEA
jgi:hypothetical protein